MSEDKVEEKAFLEIKKRDDGRWNNSIQDFTINDIISLCGDLGAFFRQMIDKALDENNLEDYKEAEYLLAIHDFMAGIGMEKFSDVIEKVYVLKRQYGEDVSESAKRLNRSMNQRINKRKKEQEQNQKEEPNDKEKNNE